MSPITFVSFLYDASSVDRVPPSNLRDINTRASSARPGCKLIWIKTLVLFITKALKKGAAEA
jgi:hypothetical protein